MFCSDPERLEDQLEGSTVNDGVLVSPSEKSRSDMK